MQILMCSVHCCTMMLRRVVEERPQKVLEGSGLGLLRPGSGRVLLVEEVLVQEEGGVANSLVVGVERECRLSLVDQWQELEFVGSGFGCQGVGSGRLQLVEAVLVQGLGGVASFAEVVLQVVQRMGLHCLKMRYQLAMQMHQLIEAGNPNSEVAQGGVRLGGRLFSGLQVQGVG